MVGRGRRWGVAREATAMGKAAREATGRLRVSGGRGMWLRVWLEGLGPGRIEVDR